MLFSSESVSTTICHDKFVWNFTHFWPVLNENICLTSECYAIKQIFSVQWDSLVIRYSTNIFSSMILFGSVSVSRQFARINLYEISHTSETSPKWKDLFNIWMLWYKKIFPVHWYSLVMKVFRRQFATINLYEISHTSETSPKWKDLFNIWMLWYSTNIFS